MAFARRTQTVFFRPDSESHFARARARFTQSTFFLPFSFEHFASAFFSRCLLSHCTFFLPLRPEQAGFGGFTCGFGGVVTGSGSRGWAPVGPEPDGGSSVFGAGPGPGP